MNRPPHKLPLPLVISVPPLLVLGHHGDVGGSHGLGAILHKLKARFLVRGVQVVEEDTSNASGDLQMFGSSFRVIFGTFFDDKNKVDLAKP